MTGIFGRIGNSLRNSASRLGAGIATLAGRSPTDPRTVEELEEELIAADLGPTVAARIAKAATRRLHAGENDPDALRKAVAMEIADILRPSASPFPVRDLRPQVVLFVGVNGSGKTTTIAKLGRQFLGRNRKVLLVAGDTFRAAAVEQLVTLGTRLGIPVMRGALGADPAGLVWDAWERAVKEDVDLLLIDTAGRLQNKRALMDELAKMTRVLGKRDPSAPHDCVLTLDATTGQNALAQAKAFTESAGVTGLIMTKLDGSARGGMLVAVAEALKQPVHAIGIGERMEDLVELDPDAFAHGLTGGNQVE